MISQRLSPEKLAAKCDAMIPVLSQANVNPLICFLTRFNFTKWRFSEWYLMGARWKIPGYKILTIENGSEKYHIQMDL